MSTSTTSTTRSFLPWLIAACLAGAGCATLSSDAAPSSDQPASFDAAPSSDHQAPSDVAAPSSDADDPSAPARPEVPPLHPSVDDFPDAQVTIHRADRGSISIPVKHADSPERRARGLMEVPHLPRGTGMLFTFEEDRTGGFWMKDTLVPLDIAFVDADGEVVETLAMEPCVADPCEVYAPDRPYRVALEVPRGWLADVDIGVGDRIDFTHAGGL